MTIPCVSREPREPLMVEDKPKLPQSLSSQLLAPLFESDVIFLKRVSQSLLLILKIIPLFYLRWILESSMSQRFRSVRITRKTDVLELFLGQCYRSLQKNSFLLKSHRRRVIVVARWKKNFVITFPSGHLVVHCQNNCRHSF